MLLYAISVLFSTTVLALPNGRTEVTYPSLETLRSGMKIMTVRAFGKDVELKLKSAGDVIADDFTIMDGDGKIQKSNVENLKRKLFRNEEKDAALYINEEGPLEIKGMLTSKLRIEPYESQDMVKDGIKAHRITETLVERKGFNNADQVDVVYPTIETFKSGEKRVKFRTQEQEIDLKLEPAGELIANEFTITDAKNTIKHNSADVYNLKKKLFRNKKNGAALHIDEDGPLRINGLIDSKVKIQPCASNENNKDGKTAHCIIKSSANKIRHFSDAIISPSVRKVYSNYSVMKMRDDQCVVIDYMFVTESNFTHGFRNLEEIKVYLSIAFVGVQTIMDRLNLRIKVRLIGIIPFTEGNDPSFIQKSEIVGHEKVLHANKLMDNMIDYYCKQKDKENFKQADIIMLITRRTLGNPNPDGTVFTGITGIANIAGTCEACGKCGVVTDNDDYIYRDATIAHESAHLLGSPHDGEGPELGVHGGPGAKECPGSDGFIMGDYLGENKKRFSNCTRENIKYFLNTPKAQCIIEDCKEHNK